MAVSQVRRIGLDPGFSSIKVAEVKEGQIETVSLPSVVGLAARTESGLGLAGVVRSQQRRTKPLAVAFQGVEYLVGPNVAEYTRPIARMDFDRFRDSQELRASLYTALALLFGHGRHTAALALALPVEIMQEKTEAQRVEREMRHWMVGEHIFAVEGEPVTVAITTVKARISQPAATWFDWGLDLTGQWARGSVAAKAPMLVIDEGFNTLDVLVVQGGRIRLRHTAGETLGMRRAAERLADSLNRKHRLELDVFTADALMKSAIGGDRPQVYKAGAALDITGECRQAIRSLEADVFAFIERNVGKGTAYNVLLTGGGALAFAERLQRHFTQATVMPEPVLANARGLAKLAARDGFLD